MIPSFYNHDLLKQALAVAKKTHETQLYGNGEDYFSAHIIKIVDYLAEHHESCMIQIIGALHDIYEDTNISREEIVKQFGVTVDGAVFVLTRQKDKEDYFNYIRRIRFVDMCKTVKLADLACNYKASVEKRMTSFEKRYSKAILILLGYAE
jgi:(p)ppGpp synthase/HD superfamily hydrolase